MARNQLGSRYLATTCPGKLEPKPSGGTCPRCGSPLYWNIHRTTETCHAPRAGDPGRMCSWSKVTVKDWVPKGDPPE